VGTVFRKTFTKPLPANAETFVRKGERFARWKDRRGKTRTAPVTVPRKGKWAGRERIVLESPYYVAKYRDGAGVVQVAPTGCRDETAARQVLADLERRAELVRSGVMSGAEAAIGRHHAAPITEHINAYITYLEAAGCCKEHRKERRRQLRRLAAECGFATLADLDRGSMERWLAERTPGGMGARTRNSYLTSVIAFCNWCCEPGNHRLAINPFDRMPKANEKADPRRQRRAMTEAELLQLLDVARQRPLLDALTVRRGRRKGERYAKVRPEVKERLQLVGRERALIYKTLVLTGLRKGELASVTVAQLHLDEPMPYADLDAADEKSREGNAIAIREDLAADLREWLADKLRNRQAAARAAGEPIPARLPPDTPVFDVPDKLSKILNRDLVMAGIARRVKVGGKWRIDKRDERGRTIDVHALRTTFGTLMSKGGIAPRTAQAAMRHSKLELTMGVYTDPKLLDVRGALDVLPALPLDGADRRGQSAALATGTDGVPAVTPNPDRDVHLLAPTLAPTPDKTVQSRAIPVISAGERQEQPGADAVPATSIPDKRKEPLTTPVSGPVGMGATGLEPVTPSVSNWCSSQLS
jgi:integrase